MIVRSTGLESRIVGASEELHERMLAHINRGADSVPVRELLPWLRLVRDHINAQEQRSESVDEVGKAIQRAERALGACNF